MTELESREVPAPFLVTSNLDDGGAGTLRWAIELANATAGADEIVFDTGVSGTIILNGSQLSITDELTIAGPGADQLAVSGNNFSRIFNISSGVTASISGLTVKNGSATDGGGIFNPDRRSVLTVSNCVFSGNSAGDAGGGIFNSATMTINNCRFSGNSAITAGGGAPSSVGGGIINCSWSGGSGAMTINNCTFSGNSASHGGGGIVNDAATMTINNSTFAGNSGYNGGGILNGGRLTVSNSTFSGNSGNFGGGIHDRDGSLTVWNSTFAGNSAAGYGGGIFQQNDSDGILTVSNTTFNANSAGHSGGGIYFTTHSDPNSFQQSVLTNVTIADNRCNTLGIFGQGGGIYTDPNYYSPTLNNTIVADNFNGPSPSTTADDIAGFVPGAHNLIGTGGSGGLQDRSVDPANGNQVGVANPVLAPLGNYGGPTQTMPLLPGSPALGAGSAALAVDASGNSLTADQRGLSRVVGGAIDIGAVENQMLGGVDNDGVSDAVENGAPPGAPGALTGDGNGDGFQDSTQVNVTSLQSNATGTPYVTLETPGGTTLAEVRAVTDPAVLAAFPNGVKAPVGHFDFMVQGVATGGTSTVTLYLPDDTKVYAYYKYGLELTDNPATPAINEQTTPHWWDFTYITDPATGISTGAKVFAGKDTDSLPETIVLYFHDGARGDDDGIANGVIVDPGAPVLAPIQVQIDIRSTVNLASQGRIAVAIFSTADFDAALVDVASVRFAGAKAVQFALQDVNADGRLDMVLQFRTQDTNLQAVYAQLLADDINEDGVLDSNHQEATIGLTGRTTADEQFEGSDTLDLFLSGKKLRDMLAELAASGVI